MATAVESILVNFKLKIENLEGWTNCLNAWEQLYEWMRKLKSARLGQIKSRAVVKHYVNSCTNARIWIRDGPF